MKIKVNPSPQNGTDRDDVGITNDDPYVNRRIPAKPGIFKDGDITEDEVQALEEKSRVALAQEHQDKLAAEQRERESVVVEGNQEV